VGAAYRPATMTITSLRILAASWNVNGKPCKEDLTPWLKVPDEYRTSPPTLLRGAAASPSSLTVRARGTEGCTHPDLQPDLYAIGLQEEDLRPEAYLQIDEERLNGWRAGIENVLLAEGDYVEVRRACRSNGARGTRARDSAVNRRLRGPSSARALQVACCQLVGLVIFVYCTRQLAPHISDVDTAMVGCGYAGVMGNKARARARAHDPQ